MSEKMSETDARCGDVSHAEAKEIALRFINCFFRAPGKEVPRASIPADPRRDDDLRLMAYIRQQEREESVRGGAKT